MDMDILHRAEELLGPAVKVEEHRNWAIFWCPFHPDAERGGKRGRPNFGIHLEKGYWRCFVCGARGPSIEALAKALGEEVPRPRFQHRLRRSRRPHQGPSLALIAYALGEARAAFRGSPAEHYVAVQRRIRPEIAMLYGLGFGVPYPLVGNAVVRAARAARMVTKGGWWLWAGGVVYAEPPMPSPIFIQVRHLRNALKYQTWGTLSRPGGAWLVSEETEALVVVEGLFDMLALAQVLQAKGLLGQVVPVYTVGGGSTAQLDWLRQQRKRKRRIYLIPDPDPAGNAWVERIREKVRFAGVFRPPANLDPDEAILEGWWPFPF